MGYEHSISFDILKTQKEHILENYSSSQYISVWDTLLLNSIKPILENTDYVNPILSEVFHYTINNFKRKISNISKESLTMSLFLFNTVSPEKRFDIYKSMKLERTITRYILDEFFKETVNYKSLLKERLSNNLLKVREVESNVKLHSEVPLNTIIDESVFYFNEATNFKEKILQKYTRMIIMEAQRHYTYSQHKIDMDTIIQTMFQYASYALDKYDVSCGTLVSYIKTWLQHARDRVNSYEVDTAYRIPVDRKQEIQPVETISLEEHLDYLDTNEDLAKDEDKIERYIEDTRVRELAKLVDKTGLGRISLDIQEILSKEEYALLKEHEIK